MTWIFYHKQTHKKAQEGRHFRPKRHIVGSCQPVKLSPHLTVSAPHNATGVPLSSRSWAGPRFYFQQTASLAWKPEAGADDVLKDVSFLMNKSPPSIIDDGKKRCRCDNSWRGRLFKTSLESFQMCLSSFFFSPLSRTKMPHFNSNSLHLPSFFFFCVFDGCRWS